MTRGRPPVRTGEVADVAIGWYATQQDCENVRSTLSELEIGILGTLAEERPAAEAEVNTACISEVDQAWGKWPPSAWVGVIGLRGEPFSCRTVADVVADPDVRWPIWEWYHTRAECKNYMKKQMKPLLDLGLPSEEGQCFYCVRGTDPSLLVP